MKSIEEKQDITWYCMALCLSVELTLMLCFLAVPKELSIEYSIE